MNLSMIGLQWTDQVFWVSASFFFMQVHFVRDHWSVQDDIIAPGEAGFSSFSIGPWDWKLVRSNWPHVLLNSTTRPKSNQITPLTNDCSKDKMASESGLLHRYIHPDLVSMAECQLK
jgi:hypothetical protein